MKRMFFATLVALIVACVGFSVVASAASRNNHSDWFDLDRINAIDVDEDLTDEATREEVALLIAYTCDDLELLPSSRVLEFDDEDDFDSSRTYKMVTRLSSTGIVAGYPNGDFGPEDDITRAEALAMIVRTVDYLGLETDSYRRGSGFSDTDGHWAEVYCQRAYEEGLVSGRGNGRFYPDDDITREEVITIMVNLMGESNNPLISAIDDLYGLEFDNRYVENRYDDDDDYYDRYYNRYDDDDDYYDRYDDDDIYDRPVVNTGNSSSSSNSSVNNSSSSSKRPTRPVVDLSDSNTSTSSSNNSTSNNGSRPARPTVDVSESSSASASQVERPTVDVEANETVSERPARPTV